MMVWSSVVLCMIWMRNVMNGKKRFMRTKLATLSQAGLMRTNLIGPMWYVE